MSFVNAIRGTIKNQTDKKKMLPKSMMLLKIYAYKIKELINDEATKRQQNKLRSCVMNLKISWEELKIKLVVLVDDLDRCLPNIYCNT